MSENIITLTKISLDVQEFESKNPDMSNPVVMDNATTGWFVGADGTYYDYTIDCTITIKQRSDILMMEN